MQIVLKPLKRGQDEAGRDTAVIENRLLSATDVGIFFRVKRALETCDGLEFYINNKDIDVITSLMRLEQYGYIEVVV